MKNMKKKIIGVFILSLIFLAFSIAPAIHGSEISRILKNRNDSCIDNNGFNIIEFLKKIKNQGNINSDKVFYELKEYLDDREIELSLFLFKYLCNKIKNKLGEDGYNEFMSFFEMLLQYANSHQMTMQNVYISFHDNMKRIQTEIQSFIKGTSSEFEYYNSIDDLLKIYKPETSNLGGSSFETYWIKYGQAKCYWDGYMPSINSPEPSKRNINKNLGIWRGDNYYDWSENAAKYILGTQDSPQATFYVLNLFGLFVSALVVVIGLPLFIAGLFSGDNDSIGKLTLGGGLSLIGVTIVGIMLWYDWTVLNYFLFGTNAYLECLRYGNVDFMVHVVNETGNDINTSCSVTARSTEAFNKENEPVYPGFHDVNWSTEEFEYILEKVTNHNGDEYSIFNLHSSQESPEKWKKAVPPPGIWEFTVNAEGYQEEKVILEKEMKPGNCFNITIQLKKL